MDKVFSVSITAVQSFGSPSSSYAYKSAFIINKYEVQATLVMFRELDRIDLTFYVEFITISL